MEAAYKPELAVDQRLTMDTEGYIYWRGVEVEHYSHTLVGDYIDTLSAEGVERAKKLVSQCLQLEAMGYKPRPATLDALWSKEGNYHGHTYGDTLNLYRIRGERLPDADEHWETLTDVTWASFASIYDMESWYKSGYGNYIRFSSIVNLTQGDTDLIPADYKAVEYGECAYE